MNKTFIKYNSNFKFYYNDLNGSNSVIAANLADNLDSADKCGRTALIHSVLSERIEICDMLLKASVDINKQDILGRTALHWAAIKVYHYLGLFLN